MTLCALKIKDSAETAKTFAVSNKPRSIEFRLDGEVKSLPSNKRDSLSNTASFRLNEIDIRLSLAHRVAWQTPCHAFHFTHCSSGQGSTPLHHRSSRDCKVALLNDLEEQTRKEVIMITTHQNQTS